MGKPKGKDCLEDPGTYRMVILTWILQKLAVIAWIRFDSSGLEQNQVVGFCEGSTEHAGSIKCREFLDYMRKKKKNYPHVVSQ
jgi:hypothetical protein